jgi:large subunit ribosomal protein L24
MHVKKGDNIIVLAGKDKGKTGKILRALPKTDQVIAEGVNVRKVFERTRGKAKGGLIDKTYPVHVSNVALDTKKPKAKKEAK